MNLKRLLWGLRCDIDFRTPYPIEDCYNMIFEYAPVDDFSYTQWGDTPGNILDGQMFIGTYHQDEGHLDFVMKSVNANFIPKIDGFGSFKTEGDNTHIIGQVHCSNGWTSYIHAILVSWVLAFGVNAVLMWQFTEGIWVITLGLLVVWTAWLYVRIIRRVIWAGALLEEKLGQKMSRKRKVADTQGG